MIGTVFRPVFGLFGKNFRAGHRGVGQAKYGNKRGQVARGRIHLQETSTRSNPAKAKSLAQELVVKDKVQYLAGAYFTPDALAIATDASIKPKRRFDGFECGNVGYRRRRAPLILRTSFTLWQNTVPAAKVALEEWIAQEDG